MAWTSFLLFREMHPRSLHSAETKPVELIRTQRQQIGQIADARKQISAEHLNGNMSLVHLQIEFHGLRGAGEIVDHQHLLITEHSYVGQHPVIRRIQELNGTPAE